MHKHVLKSKVTPEVNTDDAGLEETARDKIIRDTIAKEEALRPSEDTDEDAELDAILNTRRPFGTVREVAWHVLFLALFLFVTVAGRGNEQVFYYSERMRALLTESPFQSTKAPQMQKTFTGIVDHEDVWAFLEQALLVHTFRDTWYNGEKYNSHELGMILSYNRLIGGIRLRTLRVSPDSCPVREEYKAAIAHCYSSLSSASESREGFGTVLNAGNVSRYHAEKEAAEYYAAFPYVRNGTNVNLCKTKCVGNCVDGFSVTRDKKAYDLDCSTSCSLACNCFDINGLRSTKCPKSATSAPPALDFTHKWQSAADLKELPFWGQTGVLPGSGFVVDLPVNKSEATAMVRKLKQNKFVDLATRALIIDLTVYNAYLRLFNVVRFTLEFPPTGGIFPRYTYNTVDVFKYRDGFSFVMFSEFLILGIVVILFLAMVAACFREGIYPYFATDAWRMLDLLNLLIFLVVIGLRFYVLDHVYGTLGGPGMATIEVHTIPNLQQVAFLITQESNWNAVNACLMWIQLVKYCQVSKRMSFLVRMLAKAFFDILYFVCLFVLFCIGFGQAGFLAFSYYLRPFRTLGQSILTLIRGAFGEMDYEELARANRIYGPAFYIVYYMIVALVLLNVFLAILNDAYIATRREDELRGTKYDLILYPLSGGWKYAFRLLQGNPDTSRLPKTKQKETGVKVNKEEDEDEETKTDVTDEMKNPDEYLAKCVSELGSQLGELMKISSERKEQLLEIEGILSKLETAAPAASPGRVERRLRKNRAPQRRQLAPKAEDDSADPMPSQVIDP